MVRAPSRGRAECAIAASGIAGPGGGVPGKPVGTVWFAWAIMIRCRASATVLRAIVGPCGYRRWRRFEGLLAWLPDFI